MLNVNYKSEDLVRSLIVGKYYSKKADQTLKYLNSSSGIIVEGAFLRRFQEQGFDIEANRDNKSVYDPEAMYVALAKYTTKYPDRPSSPAFKDAISLAWKAFGGDGSLKPLDFDSRELRSSVKDNKSSGAPEFTRKGDCFDTDLARARRINEGVKVPDPCVCYHRVQHGATGPKQRLVWGYPQSMTLVEARYARPIIDKFKLSRTPMAFALRRFELAARSMPIVNSTFRVGFDFSGFDSSIAPWLISEAFAILKSWFSPESVDGGWDRMVNYFIHTPILMPNGMIYRKKKGVPSGSYFTQVVDSIVNYIAIQFAMISKFGKPVVDDKLLILGDDSLFGFDSLIHPGHLQGYFEALGLKVGVDKSHFSRLGEPVQFLGHMWINGIVDRDEIDIVKRMIFPEKPNNIKDTRERLFTRALGYYCDARSAHGLYLIALKKRSYQMERCFTDGRFKPTTDWQRFRKEVLHEEENYGALSQSNIGILM